MTKNITYYSANASELARQYNSLPFEAVHKDWLNEIPKDGMVLDVGAGSGRDARYLAAKGLGVVAVEPSNGIRELAQQYTVSNPIHWIADSLPELTEVFRLQTKFDLILLSAVWMHIAPSSRERAFRKLSSLLKPNGKLIISLRHGICDDERTMYDVSADELAKFASQFGLTYRLLTNEQSADVLGRDGVTWQTVMLALPDNGTGAFPLIRNIVVNDSKSSTYKVGLLRALLRIAEGHPGAVIEQTSEYVVLPVGLVALYWLKLYKPLVDQFGMQQNSNSRKGLGFITENGWERFAGYSSNDFYIGAHYTDNESVQALYQALKDIASTIKTMPAKYTTLPGTKESVFHVELNKTKRPTTDLRLDFNFLSSLGKFCVPVHIWDSLTQFSVWIEPALINEWSSLMAGYGRNKEQKFTKLDYLNALKWEDPERTTAKIRRRVSELMANEDVACCWSGKKLMAKNYAVDHAFPFARWPNNDLWNLLPTKTQINAKKSDKLPTGLKLSSSRELIVHWWKQGWQHDQNEFFSQANLALPNLRPDNTNFEDVFEAFTLQRDRIKALQQLEDW
ncbi:SAM-dependent methyltransferase [Alteromonas sp. KC3]|uniref:class I SAM-dependent methyltransferase n=1 Tax=unclassified Alteromonas TaxID=2614992 RepID=UPI0019249760|nr:MULTISPECIES: class I SAM-dependent methyltransferase [unclassified Alteromonas]BCO17222.1 SAM-dependent methyltransferase [Alteromonas sp. KC3]BCO21211.1 SAM-dependent methyltransferase [Alteromonas sp. KC14]